MARKAELKAIGLFDKAPIEPSNEDEKQEDAPRKKKRAASTRDETLYSFTFRLRLDQRAALDELARERQRPTAPGKIDASEVLREILDESLEGR